MRIIAVSMVILYVLTGIAYATPDRKEFLEYIRSTESIWKGPENKNVVALTFDDGPKLEYCEELLDILDRSGVKATFFVVGSQAEIYPDLIMRMDESGHEICNHTYSHLPANKMSKSSALGDIQRCSAVIHKIIGRQPRYFRPSGGGYNEALSLGIRKLGMKKVFWSLNPSDYIKIDSVLENSEEYKSVAEELADLVINKSSNGDIILLHNGSRQTILALPVIIEGLRKRNFGFVTVSQIMDERISDACKKNNTMP